MPSWSAAAARKVSAAQKSTFFRSDRSWWPSFGSELNDDFYDELEESLILADAGMDTTLELVEQLRRRVKLEGVKTVEDAREVMVRIIAEVLSVGDSDLNLS